MPSSVRTKDVVRAPNFLIVAIIAVVAIASAFGIGVAIAGVNANTTPIITTVLGLFGPTIVGLFALAKAEKVDKKTDIVNDKVDGHLEKLTNMVIANGQVPPQP